MQGLIQPKIIKVKINCTATWIDNGQTFTCDCSNLEKNCYSTTDEIIKSLCKIAQEEASAGKKQETINNTIYEIIKRIVCIKPIYSEDGKKYIQLGSVNPITREPINYTLSDIIIWAKDSEGLNDFKQIYPICE